METLILLHGATGSRAQLEKLAARLSRDFDTRALDFRGHGASAPEAADYDIDAFATQLATAIESAGGRAHVFGYSMGGYVALQLAVRQPQLLGRLVTLGTKMKWDETTAQKEAQMLDPVRLQEKAPGLVNSLASMHGESHWPSVVTRTAHMIGRLGATNPLWNSPLESISTEVLLMLGDRDKMVGLEETTEVYKRIPQCRLAVLPGTPHVLDKTDTELLSFLITRFLKGG